MFCNKLMAEFRRLSSLLILTWFLWRRFNGAVFLEMNTHRISKIIPALNTLSDIQEAVSLKQLSFVISYKQSSDDNLRLSSNLISKKKSA